MPLRSVVYCSRMLYCISFERLSKKRCFFNSEGDRKLNDPFDLYGWLSALTLRGVQFTDRILHLIRETWEKIVVNASEGAESLTIRSIRTDR